MLCKWNMILHNINIWSMNGKIICCATILYVIFMLWRSMVMEQLISFQGMNEYWHNFKILPSICWNFIYVLLIHVLVFLDLSNPFYINCMKHVMLKWFLKMETSFCKRGNNNFLWNNCQDFNLHYNEHNELYEILICFWV